MVIIIVVIVVFIVIVTWPTFGGGTPGRTVNTRVFAAKMVSVVVRIVVITELYWSTTTISACITRNSSLMVMVTFKFISRWIFRRAFSWVHFFWRDLWKKKVNKFRKGKNEIENYFFVKTEVVKTLLCRSQKRVCGAYAELLGNFMWVRETIIVKKWFVVRLMTVRCVLNKMSWKEKHFEISCLVPYFFVKWDNIWNITITQTIVTNVLKIFETVINDLILRRNKMGESARPWHRRGYLFLRGFQFDSATFLWWSGLFKCVSQSFVLCMGMNFAKTLQRKDKVRRLIEKHVFVNLRPQMNIHPLCAIIFHHEELLSERRRQDHLTPSLVRVAVCNDRWGWAR